MLAPHGIAEQRITRSIDDFIQAVPLKPACEGVEKKELAYWKSALLLLMASDEKVSFDNPQNRKAVVTHMHRFKRDLAKNFVSPIQLIAFVRWNNGAKSPFALSSEKDTIRQTAVTPSNARSP